jgi:aminoglycoside phosphotransferase (APT) family kinase protein
MLEQAVSWAEDAWGRQVEHTQRIVGGVTSTMVALTAVDGEQAVLRVMTNEPWRTHAEGLLTRESQVQRQLARSSVPAPTSISVDPTGATAGEPVHLMSRLPGRLELGRADDGVIAQLAELLVQIHTFEPGGESWPRAYQSWAPPSKRVVPAWATRAALWREAFEVLEQEAPAYRPRFLHRDYHPGNVLWDHGRISGVVDWVETSTGPAALDVAHCTTGLALLHGLGVAGRFARAYAEAGGRVDDRAYWQVMDVVGFLPSPRKVTEPWRAAGREMEDALAEQRLEDLLEAALSDL